MEGVRPAFAGRIGLTAFSGGIPRKSGKSVAGPRGSPGGRSRGLRWRDRLP
jgi:hypothetical protein